MAKKIRNRVPPTIDLIAYAQEHLVYEAGMFVQARETLNHTAPKTFPMNAMVEVCVLHLRNLVDFFYPTQNVKDDDVIAADYVVDWGSACPVLSAVLEEARKRAHKEMAHLTTSRISCCIPKKAWDFAALSVEMQPVVAAFTAGTKGKVPAETVSVLLTI